MNHAVATTIDEEGSTYLKPPAHEPIPERSGRLIHVQPGRHEEMGKIIRDWVRGVKPIPTNVAELKYQLEVEAGHVIAKVSDALKSFRFEQPLYYGDYVIPLPHIDELEAAIAEIGKGEKYDLPECYEIHINGEKLSDEALLWNRIGDYTLSNCM